jgi:hypothetical protein
MKDSRMRAYSVSFSNAPTGPGRRHRATYKSAVVIAEGAIKAADLAEACGRRHWPKLHLEEIRLDDNTVIME